MKLIIVLFIIFSSNLYSKNYKVCNKMFSKEKNLCISLKKRNINDKYITKLFKSEFFHRRDAITKNFLTKKEFRVRQLKEKNGEYNFGKEVPRIKKHLRKFRTVYKTVEKKYNVNKEIIASILMKETNIGKKRPYHNSFVTLNTIYMEFYPVSNRNERLISMAKNNLVNLIVYSKKHNINLTSKQFDSSFAGAIGINQFMPSSFVYAKPWNSKSKRANLWAMEDAITSTAYFLNKKGKFDKKIKWTKISDIKEINNKWMEFSKKHKKSSFAFESVGNSKLKCFACDKEELIYISKYVKKIMKYNFSSNYSLSVMKLAYLSSK